MVSRRHGFPQIAASHPAAFDRLGRADGAVDSDSRLTRLRVAIKIVLDEPEGRAEQVQMVFSRPYEDGWLDSLKAKPR
jgi:hypothetical protein